MAKKTSKQLREKIELTAWLEWQILRRCEEYRNEVKSLNPHQLTTSEITLFREKYNIPYPLNPNIENPPKDLLPYPLRKKAFSKPVRYNDTTNELNVTINLNADKEVIIGAIKNLLMQYPPIIESSSKKVFSELKDRLRGKGKEKPPLNKQYWVECFKIWDYYQEFKQKGLTDIEIFKEIMFILYPDKRPLSDEEVDRFAEILSVEEFDRLIDNSDFTTYEGKAKATLAKIKDCYQKVEELISSRIS